VAPSPHPAEQIHPHLYHDHNHYPPLFVPISNVTRHRDDG
jgi:hypothetical protein